MKGRTRGFQPAAAKTSGRNGKARKVFEAERQQISGREDKKDEYGELEIEIEVYDLNGNKQP